MAKSAKSIRTLIIGLIIAALVFAIGMTVSFILADKLGKSDATDGKSSVHEIVVENGYFESAE